MSARLTALRNITAVLFMLGTHVGAEIRPAGRITPVAGFWTLASVAARDGDALPRLPVAVERMLCDWAASRDQLTIAPGSSSVTIVDGVGGMTVFSTSGVPERHQMGGGDVLVTTWLEQTALRQRFEIEGGAPFALTSSLNVERGQLVATLSVGTPTGHLITERRIYTSDALP